MMMMLTMMMMVMTMMRTPAFNLPSYYRFAPDSMYLEERESEQTSPVLMVDATGHHKSPDLAEVPVVTGIVNSPVRVVCHSPRSMGRERSGLENPVVVQRSDNISDVTGHLEAGRRVKVASVPSVNLLDSSARKKDLSPSLFNSGSDLFHFNFVWFQNQKISILIVLYERSPIQNSEGIYKLKSHNLKGNVKLNWNFYKDRG